MNDERMHGGPPNPRDVLMQKAIAWYQSGRFDLAERTIVEGLRQTPGDARLHALLASVYLKQTRNDDAVRESLEALQFAPLDDYCLYIAGLVHMTLGRHKEAEDFFLQALRQDPTDAETLLSYAALMHKTGHLEKAQKLVESSLRYDPDNERAHSLLACIHSESKTSQTAAISHAQESLRLHPETDLAYSALAIACLKTGRPFEARRHAREAVRLDPSDTDAVQLYEHCDFVCRWTYLPMYYMDQLASRIPGQQYTIWFLVIIGLRLGRGNASIEPIVSLLALGWFVFCIYSWLASAITKLWIKVVPLR